MRSHLQNPSRFSLLGRAAFGQLLTLIFNLANERLKSIFHIQALTLTTILANERLRSSYSYLRMWENETLILVVYAGVRSNGGDRLPYPSPNPGSTSGKNERLRCPQAIRSPEQSTAEIVFHIPVLIIVLCLQIWTAEIDFLTNHRGQSLPIFLLSSPNQHFSHPQGNELYLIIWIFAVVIGWGRSAFIAFQTHSSMKKRL